MTDYQKATVNMAVTVRETIADNQTTADSNASFKQANGKFNDKFDLVTADIRDQNKTRSGTNEKRVTKDKVITSVLAVTGPAYAWAVNKEDFDLKEQMDWSKSGLNTFSHKALNEKALEIIEILTPRLADLVDTGLKQAKLDLIKTNVEKHARAMAKPRSAVVKKSKATKNLSTHIKEMMKVLREEMDKLIVAFEDDYPDFVKLYRSSRIIVNPGRRKKAEDNAGVDGVVPPATIIAPAVHVA